MGTRHLTIVKKDAEYKVAQYGQWDGYPEYTGVRILEFCKENLDTQSKRNIFAKKVDGCHFLSEEEINNINDIIRKEGLCEFDRNYKPRWAKIYPALSRDTGYRILDFILHSRRGRDLVSDISFVTDSLFCEWAWMIDLDKNEFVAFNGFNEDPLDPDEEFYKFDQQVAKDERWRAVKFAAKWSLDALPSNDEFLATFKNDDV